MKKYSMMIVLILVMLVIPACGSATSSDRTDSILSYEVIKSTGLYSALDINADMIAELSVGTLLEPADGRNSLYCDSFDDSGMTFTLCEVKVVQTGKTGWVLKKWVEKK